MRFRTRLLLLFVPIVVVSNLAVTEYVEHDGEDLLYRSYQAKALSIAASAAVLLDGDAHARLSSRDDEAKPEYEMLRTNLRRIRDANRRDDTYVKYLYTLVPAGKDGVWMYGIDPEESLESRSRFGDIFHSSVNPLLSLASPLTTDGYVTDEFGSWLSAFYPLRDSSGKPVALVAVDTDKARVQGKKGVLMWDSIVAVGIAIVGAFLASLLVARRVSRPLEALRQGMEAVGRGCFDPLPLVETGDEFQQASETLVTMANGLRERERVKSAFARYVSQQVADVVLSEDNDLSLTGQRRRITVLFCDIRGFTTMSEQMRPEEVVAILNRYFEVMVDAIFRHQGTLDKFIGDGLMAIFGAPVDDPYQEEHALAAAVEMRRELRRISADLKRDHGIDLRIGIGINSGSAVVGNIGSSKRMEYTAIGDTVNLASRLESQTKEAGVELLLSEYTYAALRGGAHGAIRKVGSLRVKGRSEEVTAYTVTEDAVAHEVSA